MKIVAYIGLIFLLAISLLWTSLGLLVLSQGNGSVQQLLLYAVPGIIAIIGMALVHKRFSRNVISSGQTSSPVLNWIFVGSLLFAFVPFIFSVLYSVLVGNDYGAISSLSIITLPVGIIVAVISGVAIFLKGRK